MQQTIAESSESNEYHPTAISIAELIRLRIREKLDPEIQKQLATLTNLLPQLDKVDDIILNAQAQIAADALLAPEPNVDLAKAVTKRLAERLKARTGFYYSIINKGSPASRVVLGLGVLLYLVLPLSLIVSPIFSKYDTVAGISIRMLGLVAFSGALGSIVSILIRLHEFSSIQALDPTIFFFTGLFKPIVGTAFALFIFVVISSGLLPITIAPEKAQYILGIRIM
jgi:hypothetical protein